MDAFIKALNSLIRKALKVHDINEPFYLEVPSNREFGDLSLNIAMRLAGQLRRPPMDIAQELKLTIERLLDEDNPGISRVEALRPGFINFHMAPFALREFLHCVLDQGAEFFRHAPERRHKVLLEFASANPTGPLSIAHGRQAVVGDVMASVLSFAGDDVQREYYINDEGKQISLFAESVQARMRELQGLEWAIPEGGYQGEYVKDTAAALIADGIAIDDLQAIREAAVSWNMQHIRATLEKAGIVFDSWVSQKKIETDGEIHKAIAWLQDNGFAYEADGAQWFRSTAFGDDKDRVLVRSDSGEMYTYFAADIAYHRYKLERGFDVLIDLWGPDHHGYIKRVEAALDAYKGGFSAYTFEVIIIQLVTLKDAKMSKRKGTIIKLDELVDEVGRDAARFYYLLRRNSSHLEFDVDLAKAKSMDNPLYYIQYAHARIASILARHGVAVDYNHINDLKQPGELNLIKDILQLRSMIKVAAAQREPYMIIDYLKGLAASFHKFYETHRVLDENAPDVTNARLALIEGVKVTLATGLRILGVSAPESM